LKTEQKKGGGIKSRVFICRTQTVSLLGYPVFKDSPKLNNFAIYFLGMTTKKKKTAKK